MRKSKFSESQIAEILNGAEAGLAVADVARKHGISMALLYQWRDGRLVDDLQRTTLRAYSAIGRLPPLAFKRRWQQQQSLFSSGTG